MFERRKQMNIYKKLTAFFLASLMLLSLIPAQCFAAAEETDNTEITSGETAAEDGDEDIFTIGGVTYQLLEKEAYIVGGENASGNIEFPSEIEGRTVTKICEKAFLNFTDITAVVIPESVKTIEDYAFSGCTNLSYIKILSDEADIGYQAFYKTAAYLSQKKPDEPNYIDGYLIDCNQLVYQNAREVTIKEETRGIVKYAFYNIGNLRKVKIPSIRCHIFDSAMTFQGNLKIYAKEGSDAEAYAKRYSRACYPYCAHTNKIEYPETDTTCVSIGYTAGVQCDDCNEWLSGHEFKTDIHHRDENGDKICDDCKNTVTRLVQSGKCGETAYFALYDNQTAIVEGRGRVDSYIFTGSQTLQRFIIREGITSISNYAFDASIYDLQLPESLVSIGDCAFRFTYIQSLVVPDGVVSLGKNAFGTSVAESIHLGKSLQSIDGPIADTVNRLKEITVSPENQSFTVDENGVLFNKVMTELICYPPRKTETAYTVPDTVKRIGNSAFRNAKIETVVLPEGLEEIGENAFDYCQYLTGINLPESLTVISDMAFYSCRRLGSFVLPQGLTVIGENAFFGVGDLAETKGDSIRIPGGVKEIGDSAFKQCDCVKNLTIEEGVERIGARAFYQTDVTRVELPQSVVSIGSYAFAFTFFLREFIYPDTITSTGIGVLRGSNITKITLPDSITRIDKEAFYDCRALSQINFPENLETIGSFAFDTCSSLPDPVFNDSLKRINEGAFSNCDNIRSLECNRDLTFIGAKAFYNCDKLETVTFNDSLKEIGEKAFINAALKGTLVFPSSLKTIGYQAFWKCQTIESIEFNDGLTVIGNEAFAYLTKLTSVTLPGSITSLGSSVFADCPTLESATFGKGTKRVPSKAFANDMALRTVNLPDGLYYIDSEAFSGCRALAGITLPESLFIIYSGAFRNCSALKNIVIPDDVTQINSNVFNNCTALESVTLGKDTKKICSYAFYNCSALESISLPDSVTLIEDSAFSLSGLTGITIPAACTRIGDNCFFNCQQLDKITLNEGLKTIGATAFNGTFITKMTLPSTVKNFTNAFKNNTTIEKVILSDGIEKLSKGAFSGASALYQVEIPDSVNTIKVIALSNCTSLKTLTLPDNIRSIDSMAFSQSNNLKQIKVNKGSVTYQSLVAIKYAEKYLFCRHNDVKPGDPSSGECPYDYECPRCGEKIVQYRKTHTAVTDREVAPTCSSTGLTEGSHCASCGKVLIAQTTIAKLPHTVAIDKAVAATCTSTGLTEGSHCSVCGKVLAVQKTVAKTPHTPVIDKAVPPTAKDPGLTEGSHCSVCGYILVRQQVVDSDEYNIIIAGNNDTVTAKQVIQATASANGSVKKVVFYNKGRSVANETKIYKIGAVTLSETKAVYDGKVHRPKVSVKDSRNYAISSQYYTVTYSNANARYPGRYSVTVTFKGYYAGKKVLYFYILPETVTGVKAVSSAKRSATVSFTKAQGVNGYEIYYSYSKDKGYKKLAETTKTSYTYNKFTSGKAVYFRVRAYRTVGSSRIYGSLSSPKGLKIK